MADELDELIERAIQWYTDYHHRYDHSHLLRDMIDAIRALRKERDDIEARKDAAYEERNRVVAALASRFYAGTARTAIEGWSDDWHGCVYIDLPTGQVSWHFHDSQAWLFSHLLPYRGEWDGHTTEEKYERLLAFTGVDAAELARGDAA